MFTTSAHRSGGPTDTQLIVSRKYKGWKTVLRVSKRRPVAVRETKVQE